MRKMSENKEQDKEQDKEEETDEKQCQTVTCLKTSLPKNLLPDKKIRKERKCEDKESRHLR
jgi:hypothetical protein